MTVIGSIPVTVGSATVPEMTEIEWPNKIEPICADEISAILAGVGVHLRAVRTYQRRLLTAVARQIGVSASVLSRLETAQRGPSLRHLIQESAILAIRPSDVLRAAEDEAFPLGNAPWNDRPIVDQLAYEPDTISGSLPLREIERAG